MPTDPISGALKLRGLPDLTCVRDLNDLAKFLVDNILIELPGDINSGVFVGPNQPPNPAVSGIWVKTDTSGTFIGLFVFSDGAWLQLDEGGCSTPPVTFGNALVCAGAVSHTLSGSSNGQVLTLFDNVTGVATYDVLGNRLDGRSRSTGSLGGTTLHAANLSFFSNIVDFTITNTSIIRNLEVGLSASATFNARATNTNTTPFTVLFVIDTAFDAGAYTQQVVSGRYFYSNINTPIAADADISVNMPLGLALVPGASTVLHVRLSAFWSAGTPGGTYIIDASFLSALLTKITF